ncbi:Hypothetical protein PBC10988_37760 [Planctomycetales bacterium 10988]|nr:Hypothetical protein PBC10988_37760 [Planctomycetales bacterium 10988]
MMLKQDYLAIWQERLADQLRRGSILQVRTEERDGLHHVVGAYQNSEGSEVWDSYAYFSKQELAEEAVKVVRRLAAFENN